MAFEVFIFFSLYLCSCIASNGMTLENSLTPAIDLIPEYQLQFHQTNIRIICFRSRPLHKNESITTYLIFDVLSAVPDSL